MNRYSSLLALSLILVPAFVPALAGAQERGHAGTSAQQRACRSDVLRYCRDLQEDYAMANCLRAHESQLRPACRQALRGR